MSLVEMFVRTAKQYPNKLAVADRATGHRVTYKAALLRSLILSREFDAYDPGFRFETLGFRCLSSGGEPRSGASGKP